MQSEIIKHDPASEYYFDEGCYITELSNTLRDPDVSIARARVAPGVTTRWHVLEGIVERYAIIEGNGCVEVGDRKPEQVTHGDIVIIPPGVRQRIMNTGDTDLIFLAICSPRFQPSSYQALEPGHDR